MINALAEVEKYLKNSEAGITLLFDQLSAEIIGAGSSIGQAFAPVGKTLLEIGADFGPIALSAMKGLLQVFVALSNVIGPLANLLLGAVKILADFAATDLGGIAVQTGVIVLVMSQLTTTGLWTNGVQRVESRIGRHEKTAQNLRGSEQV